MSEVSDYKNIQNALEAALGGLYLDRQEGGHERAEMVLNHIKAALAYAESGVAQERVAAFPSSDKEIPERLQRYLDCLVRREIESRLEFIDSTSGFGEHVDFAPGAEIIFGRHRFRLIESD